MASRVLFKARDVTVGHGRQVVLSGMHFSIEAGQAWFILGPNGAGKSTLLATLAGRLPVLAGDLVRDDEHVRADAIGTVPQTTDISLSLPTTLREMVALGLAGTRAAYARDDINDALARVDLADRAHKRWDACSGGERQRALLARALVRRPRLILLDEATSQLDHAAARELFAGLSAARAEQGVGFIAISHDLALAREHASHVLLCRNGQAEAGPAEALLSDKRLSELLGMGSVIDG